MFIVAGEQSAILDLYCCGEQSAILDLYCCG